MEKTARELKDPWLIAVWPGAGYVSIRAAYYLVEHLGMGGESELEAGELLDACHVEVEEGIIRVGQPVYNRFFVWNDPRGERDLILFLGEARPTEGPQSYCQAVIDHALRLGAERVVTIEAMAAGVRLERGARVRVAATSREVLEEGRGGNLAVTMEGRIAGLNGALVGAGVRRGLEATCIQCEMPPEFTGVLYPKGSLAVLQAFRSMAGLSIDLSELEQEARAMEKTDLILNSRIDEVISKIDAMMRNEERGRSSGGEGKGGAQQKAEPRIGSAEWREIEELFSLVERDRSQACRLKRELDRMHLFAEYEDRFLDMFKDSDREDPPQEEETTTAEC